MLRGVNSHLGLRRGREVWDLPVWSPISPQGGIGAVGSHHELRGGGGEMGRGGVDLFGTQFCHSARYEELAVISVLKGAGALW